LSTSPLSVARQLLGSAEQDLRACEVLSAAAGIGDALVGFHAQQATEKALKAVLAHAGIPYRRTHDIAELLDLLVDHNITAPPHADWLDELNPYGVEARYGLVSPAGLPRDFSLAAVNAVYVWACVVLGAGSGDGGGTA
jgi:HEPN domain-containing protein